jgi:hypothetical protein
MMFRSRPRWLLALPLVMLAVACQPSNQAPGSRPMTSGGRDAAAPPGQSESPASRESTSTLAAWPFWPTSLRVHPLTRAMSDPESGRLIIEARIEFFDADRETAKAVGELTLQIVGDAEAQSGPAHAIKTWNLDLTNLSFNRQHYDDVTRTYLFKLEVDRPDLEGRPELRAFFLGIDGRMMEARLAVRHAE